MLEIAPMGTHQTEVHTLRKDSNLDNELLMTELWQDISTGFSLALIAYGVTNLDNFLALVGLAASPGRTRPIIVGFSIATMTVLIIAASFSLLTYIIPTDSLQYLGIIPIAIGLRLLAIANTISVAPARDQLTAVSVSTVLAVNSTDTVATFGPLVAESESIVRLALIAGYITAALIFIWAVFHFCRSAGKLLGNSRLLHVLAPIMMILIGCYILFNTGTDLQPGS